MNAIQTFWTPPGLAADQIHGGWLDPRFHFMSWALSASLLDQNFNRTVLNTDISGRKILVDHLDLPYKEIHLAQEGMGDLYPNNWWVLRKISSYALSDSPFLHVDGDAFLWQGLSNEMQEKPIIAQNDQSGFQCYEIAVKQLQNAQIPLPYFFDNPTDQYNAVNMGIVGGTNHVFFKNFVGELRLFYDNHLTNASIEIGNTGFLNTLIEECFFRHYANYCQQQVVEFVKTKPHQSYDALANCMDDSFEISHVIGINKKDIYYCKQVEFQLKRRYPKTFQKVVRFIEGSWKNKAIFNFPYQDDFIESNLMLDRIDANKTVTIENSNDLEIQYLEAGENNLSKIINFERSKYDLFHDLLSRSVELHLIQEERLEIIDKMIGQNTRLSSGISIVINETIPVMNFLYPGKTNPYFLSTTYDFAFGYRHIIHRSLDDLTIFILFSCEKPITIDALMNLLVGKFSKHPNFELHERLVHKLDLKVKELLFLGLLDHLPETQASAADNTITEAVS